GLPKSTAHRIALDLAEAGLLERDGARVRLGLRLFEIGQRVPRQRVLRDAAVPYMSDLREATRQTVHLAVLEGTEVVYVEILGSPGGP
ncbi:helix-turn-helix domain-containing protein, partial [Micromonospora aurantiaca]|nr:helix-turn-helix domain-containing protein [Micromonospora aurantiaca]